MFLLMVSTHLFIFHWWSFNEMVHPICMGDLTGADGALGALGADGAFGALKLALGADGAFGPLKLALGAFWATFGGLGAMGGFFIVGGFTTDSGTLAGNRAAAPFIGK